ncbi:pmr5/Cas1p GDSL/SGNH-like acyl-esterase family protein (DUF828) [Wolffia australiana]
MAMGEGGRLFFLVLVLASSMAGRALIMSKRSRLSSGHGGHGDGGGRPGNGSGCDIFAGSWVRDESYPLYQASSCPAVDPQFNCQLYGRPDSDYQRFRWQPLSCNLPRFDGRDFLERSRGKTIMFVGDSMGRDQWESLLCLLWAATGPHSMAQLSRGDPLSSASFLEYGVVVSFYRAPFLVNVALAEGKRILRLDAVAGGAAAWRTADIISFNTGHWWTHTGSLQGWDYIEYDGNYHTDADRLDAMRRALVTWAKWVDENIDRSKTRVFFQSTSPSHDNPAEWNDPISKNCYGERTPVSGWADYHGVYPAQMRVIDNVLGTMRGPPYLLDVTALSAMRKDGHPSVYSGDLSPAQRADPTQSDCSHWCLPGLPDTWNLLLYTALYF